MPKMAFMLITRETGLAIARLPPPEISSGVPGISAPGKSGFDPDKSAVASCAAWPTPF